VKTFFFPNIKLIDVLELEFKIAYTMGIPINFDNKEFFEFVWIYERLAKEKETERENKKLGQ